MKNDADNYITSVCSCAEHCSIKAHSFGSVMDVFRFMSEKFVELNGDPDLCGEAVKSEMAIRGFRLEDVVWLINMNNLMVTKQINGGDDLIGGLKKVHATIREIADHKVKEIKETGGGYVGDDVFKLWR